MRLIWTGSDPGQDAVGVLVLIAGIRGSTPSSLMTAPSATSITHLRVVCTRKLEIESCKVVGARFRSCGKRATSKRCTQARAPHRELYDDAEGRVVRPQHAMLWPQSIISSSLFTCSGARIKDDVFQLWLNFNSYVSPTHPPICTGLL